MAKLILVLLILAGCGGSNETSEAGQVGAVTDLRSRITNAEVRNRAPADDKATKHELPVDIHGVKAKAVWRTFEDGGTAYILSAGWEIVTPVKGITLELLGTLNPTNAGSVEAPVQSEILRVRWHDNTSKSTNYGEMSVRIDASGKGSVI